MKWLFRKWIYARYGKVFRLKPPLGWSKYVEVSIWWKLRWCASYPVWRVESWLWDHWAAPPIKVWRNEVVIRREDLIDDKL